MDSVFGMCGSDWVMVVADTSVNRSIFNLKSNEDKIMPLGEYQLMASAGEQTDRFTFSQYIARNLQLQKFRTGVEPTVDASAEYMRSELAQALRKGPFQVNILFAGYDFVGNDSKLYWMDYLGALARVNKGAHGHGAMFVAAIMDSAYKPNMKIEEGLDCMKLCIEELKRRFIINQPKFICKIITKEGTKVV